MNIYKLPGLETDVLEVLTDQTPTLMAGGRNHVWVKHPQLGVILMDQERLVLDVPGLPPEPPNGTAFSNGVDAWIRDRNSYDSVHWWGVLAQDYECWEKVAPIVTQPGWRRYVPDPADTAPALPWDVEDKDEDSLEIVTSDVDGVAALVSVNSSSVYLAPAAAREAAGVLLRAVREFEERQR